jgi:hypothetical protein
MTPSRLKYEAMQNLYEAQRERRETIRNSVATPVAAFAFSIYNLSAIATNFKASQLLDPVGLAIAVLTVLAVGCLLAAAALIVQMERGVVYLDPPDLEELVRAEKEIRARGDDHDHVVDKLQDLLAGAYHIVYRRYFAANEQAARDRTRGLRLVLAALGLLSLALLLLPLHIGGGG